MLTNHIISGLIQAMGVMCDGGEDQCGIRQFRIPFIFQRGVLNFSEIIYVVFFILLLRIRIDTQSLDPSELAELV